ncbi:hypothetical protein DV736_g6566, partial [Chaetothyriales sp. CBS 134916]
MKASTYLHVTLLGLAAQLSQASQRRTANISGSAYLNIEDSSNRTLNNFWGYVDPNIGSTDVVFQFTADKAKATNFSITSDC